MNSYVPFMCSSDRIKPSSYCDWPEPLPHVNCEVCCSIYINYYSTASLNFKPDFISLGVLLNQNKRHYIKRLHEWWITNFKYILTIIISQVYKVKFKNAVIHYSVECQKCDITAYSTSVVSVILNIFTKYL